jgi:hypothetical protein
VPDAGGRGRLEEEQELMQSLSKDSEDRGQQGQVR